MVVMFVINECSYELNLEYWDIDCLIDVISLEYKFEVDIFFDEEDLIENFEFVEMLEDFDFYIGEFFIFIDKVKE